MDRARTEQKQERYVINSIPVAGAMAGAGAEVDVFFMFIAAKFSIFSSR